MKLMTKKTEQSLPALDSQDGEFDDAIAYVKFFTPDSNWTWYGIEYDPKERKFFGMCEVICRYSEPDEQFEWIDQGFGYFSLDALENRKGLDAVEWDRHFEPTAIRELRTATRDPRSQHIGC